MRVPSRAVTWRCWTPGTISPKLYPKTQAAGVYPAAISCGLEVDDRGEASARVFLGLVAVGRRRGDHARRGAHDGRGLVAGDGRAAAGAKVEREMDARRDCPAQARADLDE